MIKYIFEILFVISSLAIIYKIINNYYIDYTFNSYLIIISILFIVCQFAKNNTQLGGKENFTQELLNKCGLSNEGTSHCFNDSTHHTCCMLGPKARAYADKSGNPIGKASIRAYKNKKGKKKFKNETLTPWCTCTGSEVCSYYANKFNDGTYIKFINNPNTNEVAYNPKSKNEGKYKNRFNIYSHRTPGIK